jgi:hypothetical protein
MTQPFIGDPPLTRWKQQFIHLIAAMNVGILKKRNVALYLKH